MPPNRGPISGLIRDGKIVGAMVKLGRPRFSRYIGYLNQLSIIRFDESNDISISWIKKKKEKQEELKNSFDRSVFCGFAEWIFIYELIDIREKEIALRIPASKNPIVIFRIGFDIDRSRGPSSLEEGGYTLELSSSLGYYLSK